MTFLSCLSWCDMRTFSVSNSVILATSRAPSCTCPPASILLVIADSSPSRKFSADASAAGRATCFALCGLLEALCGLAETARLLALAGRLTFSPPRLDRALSGLRVWADGGREDASAALPRPLCTSHSYSTSGKTSSSKSSSGSCTSASWASSSLCVLSE
jgi:hypothetical protein